MGVDDIDGLAVQYHFGPYRAAWLSDRSQQPRTYQLDGMTGENGIAVSLTFDMHSRVEVMLHLKERREIVCLVGISGPQTPNIQLLQHNDVSIQFPDDVGNTAHIQFAIGADAAVDIVGQDREALSQIFTHTRGNPKAAVFVPARSTSVGMMILRYAFKIVIILAIAGACYLLWQTLSKYTFDEIYGATLKIPGDHLALGLIFAFSSYGCLSLFDALAIRYVGKRLPLWQTTLTSFVALSLGHNIGVAALSSGAIRYRYYSRWGLTAAEVGLVVTFCGVTVGLGLATLGSASLFLRTQDASELTGFDRQAILSLAWIAGLIPVIYLLAAAFSQRSVTVRGQTLKLPNAKLAIMQIVVGTTNFALVAASLHQMLSALSDANYLKVAAVSIIANIAAIISHIPGGVGVLEATVAAILPGAQSIAAVIAFRVIYYFLPLAAGLTLLAVSEILLPTKKTSEVARTG